MNTNSDKQKNNNRYSISIPLNDDTQCLLPLTKKNSCNNHHWKGTIGHSQLQEILHQSLTEEGHQHQQEGRGTRMKNPGVPPVQIFGSDDAFLLRQSTISTIPTDDGTDDDEEDDLMIWTEEEEKEMTQLEFDEAQEELCNKGSNLSFWGLVMDDESASQPGDDANNEHANADKEEKSSGVESCNDVLVDLYQPKNLNQCFNLMEEQQGENGEIQTEGQNNNNLEADYRGEWTRQNRTFRHQKEESNNTSSSTPIPKVKFVDLTQLQKARRTTDQEECDENYNMIDATKLRMDNPGRVFHILRSVLQCDVGGSHCASPWKESYYNHQNVQLGEYEQQEQEQQSEHSDTCPMTDSVICILLSKNPLSPEVRNQQQSSSADDSNSIDYDALEQKELETFLQFRTGDASPTYYLYSTCALRDGTSLTDELQNIASHSNYEPSDEQHYHQYGDCSATTMLVYKHLPPRTNLTSNLPSSSSTTQNKILPKGCLWEEFQVLNNNSLERSTIHRAVAPPYQCHEDIYPGIFDAFLTPENLEIVTREAMSIPQWTAWPEKTHYSSSTSTNETSEMTTSSSIVPASWSVFPLCHTFPSTDPTARKFIPLTCNYVPHTARLLRETIGEPLRTALFSRLEPGTTLGAHKGWADLANHVLRVHIPLVVPPSSSGEGGRMKNGRIKTSEGLCGTWVDGCVKTHCEGEILSFDDSKTHRAYNYNTNEERVVLIVDLARPKDSKFPRGTATGSHTDELDKFIDQFT